MNDPVALKLLDKAGEMSSVIPPDDESIRTLYVGGLDTRVTEQDLKDQFYSHGEIESIRLIIQRACAFVTYTTREGAERAAEELSNKLVVKGLRLKLLWGKPQAPKVETESQQENNSARQEGLISHTHSGMLPRAVVSLSQQQGGGQMPQPPGTGNQQPLQYFNIPVPPSNRTSYPSMDPQRMGALIPNQEVGNSKMSTDKQVPEPGGHTFRPPPPLPPQHGQYPQLYPAYGYNRPQPSHFQQFPLYRPPQHLPMPPQCYPHDRPGPSSQK